MTHRQELVGPPLSRAGSDQPAAVTPPAAAEAQGPSGLERFASRTGRAAVSFLTQTPQIELDRQAAANALITAQTEGKRQEIEQGRIAAEEQLQIQNLSRIAFAPGGGPDADAALNELFARDPVQADRLFEGLGATSQAKREEAARDAAAIQALPAEARRPAILERAARIEAEGRDASQTLSLLDMDPEAQTNQLRIVQAAALTAAQRQTAAGGGGTPAEQQTFEALIAGFTPEEQETARRVEAGLTARAGTTTAPERIAEDPELTTRVAESQAEIREAGKFAELTGASRAKAIDTGFTSIEKIDANIRNLDRALEALDAGAETGSIFARFSPTIREASVELQQIQASLGLDVVQSVSFGALSEGELNLALATALPTNLDEPALRTWIVDRQAAQTKLRGYLSEQIDFLDQGGSVAGFLRKQRRDERGTGSGDTLSFDAEGNPIS